VLKNTENFMKTTTPMTSKQVIPKNWPFPVVNSQRTEESAALIAKKHVQSKLDVSDIEDALF
jgi:hypothetical protein